MKAPGIAMMVLLATVALFACCGDDHESPLQPTAVSTAKVEIIHPHGGMFLWYRTVDLLWTASPEVVSFRVYYSSNGGGYWRDVTYGRYIPFLSWAWNALWYEEHIRLFSPIYLVKVVGYDSSGNAVAEDVSLPFMFFDWPV